MIYRCILGLYWETLTLLKAKVRCNTFFNFRLKITLRSICLGQDWNSFPSKHFNVISTLFLGWYNFLTLDNVKPSLKNVLYATFGVHNIEQRRIKVVYFNIDVINDRKRRKILYFSTSNFTTLESVKPTLWI